MTIKELLSVYEDHYYTDVVILDESAEHSFGYGEDNLLAEYNHKDYNDWYCGQLDYFSDRDVNPLLKYMKYTVKSFTVVNDVNLNGIQCIYITI